MPRRGRETLTPFLLGIILATLDISGIQGWIHAGARLPAHGARGPCTRAEISSRPFGVSGAERSCLGRRRRAAVLLMKSAGEDSSSKKESEDVEEVRLPVEGGTGRRRDFSSDVPGGDPVADILKKLRGLSTTMREKAFDPAATADISRNIEVSNTPLCHAVHELNYILDIHLPCADRWSSAGSPMLFARR